MPPERPRRLGRGLEALLAAHPHVNESTPVDRSALRTIPVAQIQPNPYQPRREFDQVEMLELGASLRSVGLLNPIAVREAPSGHGFQLIAGERRLRAATAIGWTEIPAVVKEIDDQALLTLALVENLQRSDLNPMEEAEGYRQLMEQFSLTQAQVAEIIGKERSTVANLLRLLHLPVSVRKLVHERQLSLGHARALLALEDDQRIIALAREIVARGLSVREVEHRARNGAPAGKHRPAKPLRVEQRADAMLRHVQEELRRFLQTDVRIAASESGRGQIEIAFYSDDDLDRLLDLMLGANREAR